MYEYQVLRTTVEYYSNTTVSTAASAVLECTARDPSIRIPLTDWLNGLSTFSECGGGTFGLGDSDFFSRVPRHFFFLFFLVQFLPMAVR